MDNREYPYKVPPKKPPSARVEATRTSFAYLAWALILSAIYLVIYKDAYWIAPIFLVAGLILAGIAGQYEQDDSET